MLSIGVGTLVLSEAVHAVASRARTSPAQPGPQVVVVLGYRNRDAHRPNALNRWRVRAALRTLGPDDNALLVCCGGTGEAHGVPEAELLAAHARQCGYRGRIVLERLSRTTWQNLAFATPFFEDAASIAIVSNPLHGLRARAYVGRQRPDLASRLVRARDYQLGEWTLVKPWFVLMGVVEAAKAVIDVRSAARASSVPPRDQQVQPERHDAERHGK